jgi:hypothetical protein
MEIVFVPLTKGKVAVVDFSDFEKVRNFRWYARPDWRTFYASAPLPRGSRPTQAQMHRVILGLTDPRIKADHKDGDGLNNCRDNLRIASSKENGANRKKNIVSTSGFKGVTRHRGGRWQTQVGKKYVGLYDTPEEAARAYDTVARETFGTFANLNFYV